MEKRGKVSPTTLLFIGNSFTNRNDMPGMIERLGASATPPVSIQTERVIANGMSLKFHWNKGNARASIENAKWDHVVLQEQSTLPLKSPQRMHESIRLFDDEIRTHHAKTVLYLTWARRHEFDRQPELTDAYSRIGRELDAIVVPVGVAWQQALASHPDLILHDADNSHPNFAGSYLAACVFFATLFHASKMPTTTAAADANQIDANVAGILRKIAVKTAKEFVASKEQIGG